MKKTLLTLSLVALFAHFAAAQSLQFIYNGTALADNEVVTITEYVEDDFNPGSYFQKFKPVIKNNTNEDIEFKIIKNEVDMPAGSYSTFCTDMGCFPGNESPVNSTVGANSEYTYFYGQFFPAEASSAIIKYTAQQVGGEAASATAEVHFNYDPSGIEEVGFTQFAILQGNGICRIVYSNDRDVEMSVYNITGVKIGSYILPASSNSFDLPATNYRGIAILSFKDKAGKRAAEKIILR